MALVSYVKDKAFFVAALSKGGKIGRRLLYSDEDGGGVGDSAPKLGKAAVIINISGFRQRLEN